MVLPEGQGRGAGIRDAQGRGGEWESELPGQNYPRLHPLHLTFIEIV